VARVVVLTDNLEIIVAEGDNLGERCHESNSSITFGCFAAQCGYCRIHVVDGMQSLSAMEEDERSLLEEEEIAGGFRLACQCRVLGDVTIEILDST